MYIGQNIALCTVSIDLFLLRVEYAGQNIALCTVSIDLFLLRVEYAGQNIALCTVSISQSKQYLYSTNPYINILHTSHNTIV